jgi:hypothetical protein
MQHCLTGYLQAFMAQVFRNPPPMPKSILSRPIEHGDPQEAKVFRLLQGLPDDWHIMWGYRYQNGAGETCEGDFLILGPEGGLLVVEVKGWDELHVRPDGNWGGGANDNPFLQLDGQWKAVREVMKDQARDSPHLAVGRALAVPNISRNKFKELPHLYQTESLILAQEDLKGFPAAWDRCFARMRPHHYPGPDRRSHFLESSWGREFCVDAGKALSDLCNLEIDRFTRAQFSILDHLPHYRRFVITGGAGSGKTWLALELALRWGGRGDGTPRKVLLLCYNKALAHFLKASCQYLAKLEKAKGAAEQIEVRCWEDLVGFEFRTAGIGFDPPDDPQKRQEYYQKDVPAGMQLVLENGRIAARYDALVVDEAQDHDTSVPGLANGWWGYYRALLKNAETAPIAVAYDEAQRPPFWGRSEFAAEALRGWLGPSAVQLHCPAPLRYTRQIADYLARISGTGALPFDYPEATRRKLPDGFVVEESAATKAEMAAEVQRVVIRWLSEGCAAAEEIIVIGARREQASHGLGAMLGDRSLVPIEQRGHGQIAYVSAGRCKGLDARAVIVIGFLPADQLEPSYRHSFSLAVSRARQLLAVITVGSQPAI